MKCVVHDDLRWKNQATRYILPRRCLYEWFSQFHSCGTFSVLSRSRSVNCLVWIIWHMAYKNTLVKKCSFNIIKMMLSLCDQFWHLKLCVKHTTASALIRGWRRNATLVLCVRKLSVVVMATQLQWLMKHSHCWMHKMTLKTRESLMQVIFLYNAYADS